MSWSSLRRFGESKALQSSLIWIAIVPVVATAMQKIEHIELAWLGDQFSVELRLPFSWIAFYLAACCFSIASGIYNILCPAIVRDYRNFAEFATEGRNGEYLAKAYMDAMEHRAPDRLPGFRDKSFEEMLAMDYEELLLVKFLHQFCEAPSIDENETTSPYLADLENTPLQRLAKSLITSPLMVIKPDKVRDAFWYVRGIADTTFERWRFICVVAYFLGFLLFLTVLLQNFWFVISIFWRW